MLWLRGLSHDRPTTSTNQHTPSNTRQPTHHHHYSHITTTTTTTTTQAEAAEDLQAQNATLQRERDSYRAMTQQLSESSGALTRMLDDERRRFDAERASDAQIATGIKDKLYSILDVSYKLGYRVYEETELANQSIMAPYGGRVPYFDQQQQEEEEEERPAAALAAEAQSKDELDESTALLGDDIDESPASSSRNGRGGSGGAIDDASDDAAAGSDDRGANADDDDEVAALAKFNELDADGSGTLKGPEMRALSQWVLDSFEQPNRGQRLGRLIMAQLDANGDGQLQFDEFKGWFVAQRTSMRRLQQQRSQQQQASRQEER